ncbi:MAG TPA: tetratricopeptide repeat protein [Anaerolineae bacterium]|nr:tetratricopeptide repeat protein [Anaerolineae bacterium]
MKQALDYVSSQGELDVDLLIYEWLVIDVCSRLRLNYQQSRQAQTNAIQILKATGYKKLLGEVYLSLGNSLRKTEDNSKAIEYLEQAKDIFEDIQEIDLLFRTLRNLADAYEYDKKEFVAKQCLYQAIKLQPEDEYLLPISLEDLACLLIKVKEYQEAIIHYEKALSLYENLSFSRGWQWRINELAKTYNEIGDTESAQRTLARPAPRHKTND